MKRYFCTYFDHNYLIYGMTLFDSLVNSGIDFKLFVLTLSDECFSRLENADERIVPVRLNELEQYDPELSECQFNRSRTEYIFTLSPCLPLFLFEKFPEIDLLTYLDSDLFFFDSPEVLYAELGEKSLYIIEHRFTEEYQHRAAENGRFNMAFQIYRKNETGLACLKQWRKQCIQWCYDRVEDGKFADQKYLDSWPEDFKDEVVISADYGANVAPWNINNYLVGKSENKFTVDEKNIIFVHYQGFKLIGKNIFVWYDWNKKNRNRSFFKKLAYLYFNALHETKIKYRTLFSGLEHLYPNRGAFFSPKLESMLKFVPGTSLKRLMRLMFVCLFYNKHLYFKNPFSENCRKK